VAGTRRRKGATCESARARRTAGTVGSRVTSWTKRPAIHAYEIFLCWGDFVAFVDSSFSMAPTARIVKLSGKDEDPGIDGIERYPHSDEEDSQGEEAADSQEADVSRRCRKVSCQRLLRGVTFFNGNAGGGTTGVTRRWQWARPVVYAPHGCAVV
jgi:hypothetical protein